MDTSPGKQRRKVKLPYSLLSSSCNWKENFQMVVIQRKHLMVYSQKGQLSLPCLYLTTIERNHQRDGPQLSKIMWRQLWCLFFVGNGAAVSFLVVLRRCSESSGLLHPPELCLLAQRLQWTPRTWWDVHRDRVGPSGRAPTGECFQYSELLLLGGHKNAFIKTGIKFGQPSKVRAKQMLLSRGAAFQLCVTTCALTPHLWLFHCFTRFSFWWQLSTLSSLLTPVSHASSCFIIWFHFPSFLWCLTKVLLLLECSPS